MSQEEKQIKSKATDIAHAVFRVASLVLQPYLKLELENAAVNMMVAKNPESIAILQELIRFSEQVGQIKPINAKVLHRECNNLLNLLAVLPYGKREKAVEVEVESIFSNTATTLPQGGIAASQNIKSEDERDQMSLDLINSELNSSEEEMAVKTPLSRLLSSQIRNSSIKNIIKDLGKCRLKDIMDKLPDVSERTLRYDLQRLCEQGELERIGEGGINSFYQIKIKK